MKILTKKIKSQLIKNHEKNILTGGEHDHEPVVKLFGGAACTWLLTELDPETNIAFGLCDIGQGLTEMGYVDMNELLALKFPPFGLPIERDRWWKANKTLAAYADDARQAGYIA